MSRRGSKNSFLRWSGYCSVQPTSCGVPRNRMFSAVSMRIVVSPVEKKSAEAVKEYAAKKNTKSAPIKSIARVLVGAMWRASGDAWDISDCKTTSVLGRNVIASGRTGILLTALQRPARQGGGSIVPAYPHCFDTT